MDMNGHIKMQCTRSDECVCSAYIQNTYMCAFVCVFLLFYIMLYYIVDRLLLANVPAATRLRQLPQTISRRYCPNESVTALNNITLHEIMFEQKCLKDLCIVN